MTAARRHVPNFVAVWLSDLHGSSARAAMSGEAWALYCAMFLEQPLIGGFPDDDRLIARMMRYPLRKARPLLAQIRPHFEQVGGLLVNVRMAHETAVALAKSAKQSARRRGSGGYRGDDRGSTADTTPVLPWPTPGSDRGGDQPEPEPEEAARAPSSVGSARGPVHHPPVDPPPASSNGHPEPDDPPTDDPPVTPSDVLQRGFLALRLSFDPGARVGRATTWGVPSATLAADPDRGVDGSLRLARWLFTAYRPERPDYDLRARVFTPYHLLQRWDELHALMVVQLMPGKGQDGQETCACGSSAQPLVNTDEGSYECIHHLYLARLRTVRCADCGSLHDATVSCPDICRSCSVEGNRDRTVEILRAWSNEAFAAAKRRATPPTEYER